MNNCLVCKNSLKTSFNLDKTHSPASQSPTKYRTGKNSKYRRYWLFSTANIGGFKKEIKIKIKTINNNKNNC